MSHRVFVTVDRGMTDKTATCIFPWEVPILERVHAGAVKVVTIDEMVAEGTGVVKITKQRRKINPKEEVQGLTLRQQLEGMAYISAEEDPARDPASEFNRLQEKYGMDKEINLTVVELVYGQFNSKAFEAALEKHAKERMPMPEHLREQLEDDEVVEQPARRPARQKAAA